MKKILFAIIALAMIISSLAAMANEDKNYTITPKLSYNYLLDGDLSDVVGSSAYGVLVEGSMTNVPVGLEIGYLYGSKHGNTLTMIPILATYKAPFNFDSNFYYDLGVGLAINKVSFDEGGDLSSTRFAFKIMGGWEFSEKWVAELGYVNYGNISGASSNAIQLNVGYNF